MKLKLIALLLFFAAGAFLAGCEPEPDPSNPSTPDNPPEGTVRGVFSVGAAKQVYFASGNLDVGGRKFVDNQWEFGGYFGWGTGNNPGNTSTNVGEYRTFNDWGNYMDGDWRMLSHDEWNYLLLDRADASDKSATSEVNRTRGLVILPDNWTLPSGCTFHPGYNDWGSNVYTETQWQKMESAGAVFLPAAGYRWSTDVAQVGMEGCYWTSTPHVDEGYAYYVYFRYDYMYPSSYNLNFFGWSVRLVKDKK